MLFSLAILFFWRVFLFVRAIGFYKKHDEKIKFMCVGFVLAVGVYLGWGILRPAYMAAVVKGWQARK